MLNWLRSIIGPPDAGRTRAGLDDLLRDVRDGQRELAADMKAIRLEWEETYEKVNRTLRKLAKREQRESECEDCPPAESNGGAAGESPADIMRRARATYGRGW